MHLPWQPMRVTLLQLPPLVPLLVYVVVDPTHTTAAPLTVPAFGTAFTVINFVALAVPQLLVMVYLMVAVPAVTPFTAPVVAFTVATDGVRLLQLPPLIPLLVNVAVEPMQTVKAPLTVPAFASGLTVINFVEMNEPQLFVIVYWIDAFPAATPVTKPVVVFTVATDGVTLLQLPPVVPLLVYVVVDPAHTAAAPLTVPAFGIAFTVINFVALAVPQLLVMVYLIVAVPDATPVITPVLAFTVATDGVRLLQLPPLVPLLEYVVVEPIQTADAPLTVPPFGIEIIVTLAEPAALAQPPTVLLTVYVPPVVTVIEAVVAPLLHNMVPPVGIDKIELLQLFTIVINGVAVTTGAAMPEPGCTDTTPNCSCYCIVPAVFMVPAPQMVPPVGNRAATIIGNCYDRCCRCCKPGYSTTWFHLLVLIR